MVIHNLEIRDRLGLDDGISASDIDEFTRMLFEKTCQQVRSRQASSKEERALFERERIEFEKTFGVVRRIADKQTRTAALNAIRLALSLGYYHSGAPQVVQELKRDFQTERTERARAAREPPADILRIIDRRARAFWNGNPSFRGNKLRTAKNIYSDVIADISTLSVVPRPWAIPQSDAEGYERYLDRIRKHLPSA